MIITHEFLYYKKKKQDFPCGLIKIRIWILV